MSYRKNPKVLFLMNQVRPGTGPFQRAIRLDDKVFDITILSCYDSQNELNSTASLLTSNLGSRSILGFGEKNKIALFFKLMHYLKQAKPDIVQTAHTYSAILAILICRVFGLGIVVNFEGTLFHRKGVFKSFLTKLALSPAHAAICVSHAVYQSNSFSENFLRKRMNRTVIYNGVDFDDIDNTPQTLFDWKKKISINSFVVGFVGDLKSVKDIPTLIRATKEVSLKSKDILVLIVGGGDLKSELKMLAQQCGVLEKIIFTDQIERHEVYQALKVMDVFVMPSLIEGLSESIAQSMASSLPVVVSNIAPNRELVINGENGFLFNNGDYKALARHILALEGSPAMRQKFGLKNRAIAEEKLDINKIVVQYKEFYQGLLRVKRGW